MKAIARTLKELTIDISNWTFRDVTRIDVEKSVLSSIWTKATAGKYAARRIIDVDLLVNGRRRLSPFFR